MESEIKQLFRDSRVLQNSTDVTLFCLGTVLIAAYHFLVNCAHWSKIRYPSGTKFGRYANVFFDNLIKASSSSILLVQHNRNFMYTSSAMMSASLAVALILLGILPTTRSRSFELFINSLAFLAAFVNFAMSTRITHHLSWAFIGFPDDKVTSESSEFAKDCHRKCKQLIRLREIHYSMGQRSFVVGLLLLTLLHSSTMFFITTILSIACWVYVDEVLDSAVNVYAIPRDEITKQESSRFEAYDDDDDHDDENVNSSKIQLRVNRVPFVPSTHLTQFEMEARADAVAAAEGDCSCMLCRQRVTALDDVRSARPDHPNESKSHWGYWR